MIANLGSKPVILSLLDSPAFGGAEQYMLSNLLELSARHYQIRVYTNNRVVREIFSKQFSLHSKNEYRISKFPFVLDAIGNWKGLLKFILLAPLAIIWFAVQVRKLRIQNQVICYLAGFSDRLLLSPIAKLLGCRVIWIEIGPLEPTFPKNWGFPKFLYFSTQWSADEHLTTSKWTKQSMIKTGKLPEKPITVAYPGIQTYSLAEIEQYRDQGAIWRKHHHIHKVLISFVGRLATENEVDIFIKALSLLKKKFEWQAVCVGDGPEKNRFSQIAHQLDIHDRILFTDFVGEEEKKQIVATSDIFVFPRAWELDGFGMTTIEAMALAVPVITSDFGPQKEIVIHKKNGLRFRPHDPVDLSKQISCYLQNPVLRRKCQKQGYITVNQHFSHSGSFAQTLRVIEKQ